MTNERITNRETAPEGLERLRQNFGANGTFSFAGIGVGFRGKTFVSDEDRAAGIELTTRWIILGWIPVIPIGSYKIRRIHATRTRRSGFVLVSKEPLALMQIIRVWLITAAFLLAGWFVFQVLKTYG